ncbi:hypothetical protein ACOMHN_003030 [Nucella lapillus]
MVSLEQIHILSLDSHGFPGADSFSGADSQFPWSRFTVSLEQIHSFPGADSQFPWSRFTVSLEQIHTVSLEQTLCFPGADSHKLIQQPHSMDVPGHNSQHI